MVENLATLRLDSEKYLATLYQFWASFWAISIATGGSTENKVQSRPNGFVFIRNVDPRVRLMILIKKLCCPWKMSNWRDLFFIKPYRYDNVDGPCMMVLVYVCVLVCVCVGYCVSVYLCVFLYMFVCVCVWCECVDVCLCYHFKTFSSSFFNMHYHIKISSHPKYASGHCMFICVSLTRSVPGYIRKWPKNS